MLGQLKFCDSLKRPISKNSLLSYRRDGETYYVKVVQFLDDWGTYPEWNRSLYAPGRVVIEFLENPWEPDRKLTRRTEMVDTRFLTIIPGTT